MSTGMETSTAPTPDDPARDRLARSSVLTAAAALVSSVCCLLPAAFLLAGLGGSWLAAFGLLAAGAYYVAAASVALTALAWAVAWRRDMSRRARRRLAAGTTMTGLALLLLALEGPIVDHLQSTAGAPA